MRQILVPLRNQTCHSVLTLGRFFGGNEEMGTLDLRDIIGINRKSVFNLDEARTLFPIIFRLTKSYSERVQVLIQKIEAVTAAKSGNQIDATEPLEAEAAELIQQWQSKVQKLGGLPNGHWIVDFDSGDGYYCWKYPERSIEYWHHYRDGFSKRIKLSSLEKNREDQSLDLRLAPIVSVNDL